MHGPESRSGVGCSSIHPTRPRRARTIARRLALSFALIATLLVPAAAWAAGSCPSPASSLSLTAGHAAPATGTTATTFTFSVTYADTKGCAPSWVRVAIVGAGTFLMNGGGSSYDTGVTFTFATLLPAGTHAYSFAASSGTKTVGLTSVSPPSVTVTVPATSPPPTPKPTPVPTPKPTPLPTPVPTAVPTSAPTDIPTAPTPAPPVGAPGAGSPTYGPPAPSGAVGGMGAPSGGPVASQAQGQAPGASGSEPGTPAAITSSGGMGSFPLLIGAWATATAGGLALFLILAPRRRKAIEPVLAEAGPTGGDSPPRAPRPPAEAQILAEQVPPEEANIPRWLRPSVQAGRTSGQRGSRMNTRRLDD